MKRLIALFVLILLTIPVLSQTSCIATASLKSRNVVGSLPRPSYNAQMEGTIVVQIKVDQYGNVTEAIPGAEGTTVMDKNLWNAARNAAMKAHFNMSADAPVLQTGTITYEIALGKEETHNQFIDEGQVLTFLGIPVDGTRHSFEQQLVKKGFAYIRKYDCFRGDFNGKESNVFIHENHGLVDRVMVSNTDEIPKSLIKNEFNVLLEQFKRNEKYVSLGNSNEPIPEDEDVSYEMLAHNKQYGASFFLNPVTPLNRNQIREEIVSKIEFELANSDKEDLSASEKEVLFAEEAIKRLREMSIGNVWFMIGETSGLYYISIFYDNLRNRPHGEDL